MISDMNSSLLKSRSRDRQATEETLVAAAAAAFSKYGYEGTTTRGIAEAAECSEALIQRYFGGKEGLLLAVLLKEDASTDLSGFFNRPLCKSLEEEARQTLGHTVKWLTNGSDRMRIVFSRVLLDQKFKDHFNRISIRDNLKANLQARFARYMSAGIIDPSLDLSAAAEMLLALSFELGFMQSQVLHVCTAERSKLLDHFAEFVARALAIRNGSKRRQT